jgi:hypothetical protein
MNLEDVQTTLFDMYDLRSAFETQLRHLLDKKMAPHESEATFGQCITDTIEFLEKLEAEMEEESGDRMSKILSADWSKTTAEFDGEDWVFNNVPLDACPEWHGQTCFSERDLGALGYAAPDAAIRALQKWLSTP